MIPLTNYDFQWARSELVIIYPDDYSVGWPIRSNHYADPGIPWGIPWGIRSRQQQTSCNTRRTPTTAPENNSWWVTPSHPYTIGQYQHVNHLECVIFRRVQEWPGQKLYIVHVETKANLATLLPKPAHQVTEPQTKAGWWLTYPSEKIWKSQLGLLLPIYGKVTFMFQTTKQKNVKYLAPHSFSV